MSCFCFASYDAQLVGGLSETILSMASSLGASEQNLSPKIVTYSNGGRITATSWQRIDDAGLESVEIGLCASSKRKGTTDFGLSYEKRETINSSMLFVCLAGSRASTLIGAFGHFIDEFASSGLLGYSIGFESQDEKTGGMHAAAITSGVPVTPEENRLADDDGRFFFDRITMPATSRKFHSGKLRAFHQINLLDDRQFACLAGDEFTRHVAHKYLTKSYGSNLHLLTVGENELPGINAILRSRGFLI